MNYIRSDRGFFDPNRVEKSIMHDVPRSWRVVLEAVRADRLDFYLHDLHLGGDRIGSRA